MNQAQYKKINKSGGFSIPIGLRRERNIQGGDAFEIQAKDDGSILLKPYCTRCIFCDGTESIIMYKGVGLCTGCLKKIGEVKEIWKN